MIELRWVTKVMKTMVSTNPGAIGAAMMPGYEHKRTLQCRHQIHPKSDGYGGMIIWSDWVDVPDVGLLEVDGE